MEERFLKLLEEVDKMKERIITLETGLAGYTNDNGLYRRVGNIEKKLDDISKKISLTEGILKGLGMAWIVLQILDKVVPMIVNK